MDTLATQFIIGEKWSIALFINLKIFGFKITNKCKLYENSVITCITGASTHTFCHAIITLCRDPSTRH